jgi:hypothetical protein
MEEEKVLIKKSVATASAKVEEPIYLPQRGQHIKKWRSLQGLAAVDSEILLRNGNLVLVKNSNPTNRLVTFNCTWIYRDEDNAEQVSDPTTITSLEKQRDAVYMRQVFDRSVALEEAKAERKIKEAEEGKTKWTLTEKNLKIRDEIRASAVHLQIEMQDLIDRSETLASVMANKRIREIIKLLGEYDEILKHFKLL